MLNQINYAYRIEGGYPVIGEIECLGAKNFVIKAMLAALLSDTPSTLTNVPAIGDVDITAEMLTSIGVTVERIDSEVLTMFLIVAGCGYIAAEEKEPAVA